MKEKFETQHIAEKLLMAVGEGKSFFFSSLYIDWLPMPQWINNPPIYVQHYLLYKEKENKKIIKLGGRCVEGTW